MAKKTKYPEVKTLPKEAIKISQYAESIGVTFPYIYIKHGRGKANYDIIQFQGMNFVIPSK